MINNNTLSIFYPYFKKSYERVIKEEDSIFNSTFSVINNPTNIDIKWGIFWLTIFGIHERNKGFGIDSFKNSFINVFTEKGKFIYDINILSKNILLLEKPKFSSHVYPIWNGILSNNNFGDSVINIIEDIFNNKELKEIFLSSDILDFDDNYFKYMKNKNGKKIIYSFSGTFIFDYLKNLYFEDLVIKKSVKEFSTYISRASTPIKIGCTALSIDFNIDIANIMIELEKMMNLKYHTSRLDSDLLTFIFEDSLCWFGKKIKLPLLVIDFYEDLPGKIYRYLEYYKILLFSDTTTPFKKKYYSFQDFIKNNNLEISYSQKYIQPGGDYYYYFELDDFNPIIELQDMIVLNEKFEFFNILK